MWANVGIFLVSPLIVAIVAWFKTVINLILAHWDQYLSDAHWHPFLGLHLIPWALPVVIVVLVPFGLTMLFMERSFDDIKERMQNDLQWMDSNIRRRPGQEFETSA